MSSSLVSLIIQLISGAAGSGLLTKIASQFNLGPIGNLITGAIGGVGGGNIWLAPRWWRCGCHFWRRPRIDSCSSRRRRGRGTDSDSHCRPYPERTGRKKASLVAGDLDQGRDREDHADDLPVVILGFVVGPDLRAPHSSSPVRSLFTRCVIVQDLHR